MNTSHIIAFAACLKATYRDMLNIEMQQGSISEQIDFPVRADVSACVMITGASPACVVLAFDELSAVDATNRFTQTQNRFEDSLVGDTAREILNIVVGSAQRDVADRFSFSLPVSVQGRNHEIGVFRKGRNILLPLTWLESFNVRLFLNLPAV
ncbi:MAG: chemotaxis protein CheX [Spirochaetia bacterium]|nr:chemotaxis protein CheX [Spirochaetia bacterium]